MLVNDCNFEKGKASLVFRAPTIEYLKIIKCYSHLFLMFFQLILEWTIWRRNMSFVNLNEKESLSEFC